jgi:hypothetical protein
VGQLTPPESPLNEPLVGHHESTGFRLAVLPETFTGLPSTVPRTRQRRLALTARMLERDYYLWFREHKEVCSPQRCGYPAEPEQGAADRGL